MRIKISGWKLNYWLFFNYKLQLLKSSFLSFLSLPYWPLLSGWTWFWRICKYQISFRSFYPALIKKNNVNAVSTLTTVSHLFSGSCLTLWGTHHYYSWICPFSHHTHRVSCILKHSITPEIITILETTFSRLPSPPGSHTWYMTSIFYFLLIFYFFYEIATHLPPSHPVSIYVVI